MKNNKNERVSKMNQIAEQLGMTSDELFINLSVQLAKKESKEKIIWSICRNLGCNIEELKELVEEEIQKRASSLIEEEIQKRTSSLIEEEIQKRTSSLVEEEIQKRASSLVEEEIQKRASSLIEEEQIVNEKKEKEEEMTTEELKNFEEFVENYTESYSTFETNRDLRAATGKREPLTKFGDKEQIKKYYMKYCMMVIELKEYIGKSNKSAPDVVKQVYEGKIKGEKNLSDWEKIMEQRKEREKNEQEIGEY